MPSTGGASGISEIDGGFAGNVVLVRDAFEVEVEKRLGNGQTRVLRIEAYRWTLLTNRKGAIGTFSMN